MYSIHLPTCLLVHKLQPFSRIFSVALLRIPQSSVAGVHISLTCRSRSRATGLGTCFPHKRVMQVRGVPYRNSFLHSLCLGLAALLASCPSSSCACSVSWRLSLSSIHSRKLLTEAIDNHLRHRTSASCHPVTLQAVVANFAPRAALNCRYQYGTGSRRKPCRPSPDVPRRRYCKHTYYRVRHSSDRFRGFRRGGLPV